MTYHTDLADREGTQLAPGRAGPDSATLCVTSAREASRDDRAVPGLAGGTPASGEIVTAAVDRYLDSIKTKTTRSSYTGTLARLVSCAGGRDTASLLPEDYAAPYVSATDDCGGNARRPIRA